MNHPTDISEIEIELDESGRHRIVDKLRNIQGEWASFQGIARLDMPDDMKSPETGRGFWIHTTDYWAGTLPTETLLEVY